MKLEDIMTELLDWYSLDDLIKFHNYIEYMDYDFLDSYKFLAKFTIADYKILDLIPNIDNYIELLEYRNNRNI